MWRKTSAFVMNPARRSLLAAGLLLCAVPCVAGAPDWVQQAAAKPIGSYPSDTNAVVLLDDTLLNVTGPGQAELTSRRVVRILRPAGRKQATFAVHLRAGEKVQALHAWSIDSSGRQYEVKEKDFSDVSPYGFELYSDVHYRVAEVPAGNPGSVVAFEYSLKRKLWMDQWTWSLQEENPVEEARLTVQLPSGWEYKDNWAHHAPEQETTAGPNRWQWVCQRVPGIPDEKH